MVRLSQDVDMLVAVVLVVVVVLVLRDDVYEKRKMNIVGATGRGGQ